MQKEQFFTCPYCWQSISVLVDVSVAAQTYVEDCEVCCNPFEIHYEAADDALLVFEVVSLEQ